METRRTAARIQAAIAEIPEAVERLLSHGGTAWTGAADPGRVSAAGPPCRPATEPRGDQDLCRLGGRGPVFPCLLEGRRRAAERYPCPARTAGQGGPALGFEHMRSGHALIVSFYPMSEGLAREPGIVPDLPRPQHRLPQTL